MFSNNKTLKQFRLILYNSLKMTNCKTIYLNTCTTRYVKICMMKQRKLKLLMNQYKPRYSAINWKENVTK